jgi:hypothetical protein
MGNPMEHKEFKELIHFYLYNELEKDKRVMMEDHLKNCKDCSNEYESYKKLFEEFSQELDVDVNPALLSEARSELRGFMRAKKSNQPFAGKVSNVISTLFSKPSGLAFSGVSILLAGIFSGYLIFKLAQSSNENDQQSFSEQLKIQNINFVDSDPSDGLVEFTFDAIKPGHIKGKIDNPELQSILTYALLNEQNPGTRLNSINVINATTNASMDEEVKQTFMSVAMYDQNPGVRREALNALSVIPIDSEIKNTMIYVLLNDTSSGIRIAAINSLVNASKQGIKLTSNDLSLLREKMNVDNNNYVRLQAKNILKEY